jgi:sodium borate transporter 11
MTYISLCCRIVRVRETRLTAIFSHILIGASMFIMPWLSYIPTPVLYGLFLYVGITSLYGNRMFERVLLLFTEQVS